MSIQTSVLVPSSGQHSSQVRQAFTTDQLHTYKMQDTSSRISPLIEGLLRQEQRSKHHQGQLESRIYNDAVEFQRSRAHNLQLQRTVGELQYHKVQMEASLAHMAETCRIMARNLELERAKVHVSDSRLNEVYPSIEGFLRDLSPTESKDPTSKDEGANGHLLLENQRQQELIVSLQSTLQVREETIQGLKLQLEQTVQDMRLSSFGQSRPYSFKLDESKDESSEESYLEIIT